MYSYYTLNRMAIIFTLNGSELKKKSVTYIWELKKKNIAQAKRERVQKVQTGFALPSHSVCCFYSIFNVKIQGVKKYKSFEF